MSGEREYSTWICLECLFSGVSSMQILLFLAVLMFLNSSIMVPSSEYVCYFCGMALAINNLPLSEAIVIATASNVAGTSVWFWIGKDGRWFEKHLQWSRNRILNRYFFSYTPYLLTVFERRGAFGLFLLRFVPVVRSIASLPAGVIGMPVPRFLVASVAGMGIWAAFWIALGAHVGAYYAALTVPITAAIALVSIAGFYAIGRYKGSVHRT